jgi:ABC-2 type transport system permease protein
MSTFASIVWLLRFQARRTANDFLRSGAFIWVKSLGGAAFGVLFLLWIYFIFGRVLTYFVSLQLLGGVLAERFLSLLFLTVFGLIFFSGVVSTISIAFLSSDLELLMSLPLKRGAVMGVKFLETCTASVWMPTLLFIPILMAYGHVLHAGPSFYATCILALPLFLMIPSALGFFATALLLRLFPARQVRDAVFLLGISALALVTVLLRLSHPEVFTQSTDQLQSWSMYLEELRTPAAPYLPGAWATQALLGAIYRNGAWWMEGMAKLWGVGIPLLGLILLGTRCIYEKGWYHAQESVGLSAPHRGRIGPILEKVFFFIPQPLRALFIKDLLVFVRDPAQWAQLSLLLSLIVVYLYTFRKIPLDAYADYRNMIFFISMGLSGFMVTAVGVRYIFPTVSLEGRSYWIVRSSPLTVRQFLWGKALLAFFPMALLSFGVMGVSIQVMRVDRFMSVLSLGTMLFLAVGLTAMGTGLGGVFTYFKTDNPAQVSTSLGGYIYMMSSVVFISLLLLVEATPVRLYYWKHPATFAEAPWEAVVPALFFLGLNLLVVVLPMAWGQRQLEKCEI